MCTITYISMLFNPTPKWILDLEISRSRQRVATEFILHRKSGYKVKNSKMEKVRFKTVGTILESCSLPIQSVKKNF